MSTSFRQIRKNSTAQGRFKDLVREFQRSEASRNPVENPDFVVKLRTMYSKLVYKDPFITHDVKPVDTVFFTPFEPDVRFCVGMWNLNHNGRFSIDSSGNGHYGRWTFNPGVQEGIYDGFGSSIYADFDGEQSIVYIDNYAKLNLSFVNQFSITGRIYPTDISATDGPGGNKYRTILHKADSTDISGNNSGLIDSGSVGNGYVLVVTPEGRLRFTLRVNGIKYTVQTTANTIVASDPPFAYDFTITVDQVNRRLVEPEITIDPGTNPGADEEDEPEFGATISAPRMEITVNSNFFALHTLTHVSTVDDGSFRRLRFGTAFPYPLNAAKSKWFKYKGGIQQIKMYRDKILTMRQIQYIHENKYSITEIPLGSPALAGRIVVFDEILPSAYENDAFEEDAYETLSSIPTEEHVGLPAFDPEGFDPEGFDTLFVTNQGTLQGGGYNPRGFSSIGFNTLPESQS